MEAVGQISVRVSTDKKKHIKKIACSLEITPSQRMIDLDGNNNFNVLA